MFSIECRHPSSDCKGHCKESQRYSQVNFKFTYKKLRYHKGPFKPINIENPHFSTSSSLSRWSQCSDCCFMDSVQTLRPPDRITQCMFAYLNYFRGVLVKRIYFMGYCKFKKLCHGAYLCNGDNT